MLGQNSLFFHETLERRKTQSGGNLTIIFGMQYLKWGKLKHDDVWHLTSAIFETSGYNTRVCGIKDK